MGARREALGTVEQTKIDASKRAVAQDNANLKPGQKGSRSLNRRNELANVAEVRERHNVQMGRAQSLKRAGMKLPKAFGVIDPVTLLMIVRDTNMQDYEMGELVLQDEEGYFTIGSGGLPFFRKYSKTYVTGPKTGQEIQIERAEYFELVDEAEMLWGSVGLFGTWSPGLLLRELPEVPCKGIHCVS